MIIGKVKEVLDNFVIVFEASPIYDEGKAIPLYSMMEPQVGMDVVIHEGDDILGELFFYSILRTDAPVLYSALGNYFLMSKSGVNLVTEGDNFIQSKGSSVVKGSGVGINGTSGKVMIANDNADLKTLLTDLLDFLNQLPSNTSAGGYPVLILGPGASQLSKVKTSINNLLGTVSADLVKDGGKYDRTEESSTKEGSGSSSSSDATSSSTSPTPSKTIQDILDEVADLVTQVATTFSSYAAATQCASPGSPLVPTGVPALVATLTARITKLKANIKLTRL